MNLLFAHTLSWSGTLAFFVISFLLLAFTKNVPLLRITKMILRLFYILVILTGALLLILHFSLAAVIKGLLSILLIGTMEMILARIATGRTTIGFWGLLVIVLSAVFYYGFEVLT